MIQKQQGREEEDAQTEMEERMNKLQMDKREWKNGGWKLE